MVYDATGSIHAYPNLIWPPNKKNHTVVLEGFLIDKLATVRFGESGINSAHVLVDGQMVDLMPEPDGRFSFEITVKATKGSIYPVELYAIDANGNIALLDTTYITVPHNMK